MWMKIGAILIDGLVVAGAVLAHVLRDTPPQDERERSRVYVLAGGVNCWLDVYLSGQALAPGPETQPIGDDTCRHTFAVALGGWQPVARPEIKGTPERKDGIGKVKLVEPVRHAGGGCG
jgi:hypothetical protein